MNSSVNKQKKEIECGTDVAVLLHNAVAASPWTPVTRNGCLPWLLLVAAVALKSVYKIHHQLTILYCTDIPIHF